MANLEFVADQLPVVAEDQNGNKVTLSGAIESGTLAGAQLEGLDAFIGYYFSFGAFYEDIEIYED